MADRGGGADQIPPAVEKFGVSATMGLEKMTQGRAEADIPQALYSPEPCQLLAIFSLIQKILLPYEFENIMLKTRSWV